MVGCRSSKKQKTKNKKYMSATTTAVSNKSATKSGRIKYGFTLNVPSKPFTLKQLSASRFGKIKYITLYSRVQSALEEGTLVAVGEHTPHKKVRGRRQMIYQRADAKSTVVSATPTVAPAEVPAPVAVAAPAEVPAAV